MTVFIDPLEQILMDFYLACWEKNQEGKTEIINYSLWADKIRALSGERGYCKRCNKWLILNSPQKKEEELFAFEGESKEDIDKEIDEIIGNIQGDGW